MPDPLSRIADAGAGYKAKVLASAVFVSGRDPRQVLAEDVALDSYGILRLFRAEVGADRVTVRFLGLLRPRTALFRPGRGAALAWGRPPRVEGPARAEPVAEGAPLPRAETPPALARALDAAFAEPGPKKRRTRAVVVLKDGRVLAERYAPGFAAGMPLCGWSMSKSVLSALVGIAAGKGLLRLDQDRLLPEWSGPGDPRGTISVEDLLRMRSGVAFDETYHDPLSDVTQMLFARPDAAYHAALPPLEHPPGTHWKYASGTSNVLSRVLRRALERAGEDYHGFPARELFAPLGMGGAVFETDAAGTFVGSSFTYATALGWARFGQLFLQDGVWEGRRVLPEGWVRCSTTPTPQSGGCYGAHWWLKVAREMGGDTPEAARLPADAYHALGHEGQCLTVIPSRGLVIVRLGLSIYIDAWNHARFLTDVLEALG